MQGKFFKTLYLAIGAFRADTNSAQQETDPIDLFGRLAVERPVTNDMNVSPGGFIFNGKERYDHSYTELIAPAGGGAVTEQSVPLTVYESTIRRYGADFQYQMSVAPHIIAAVAVFMSGTDRNVDVDNPDAAVSGPGQAVTFSAYYAELPPRTALPARSGKKIFYRAVVAVDVKNSICTRRKNMKWKSVMFVVALFFLSFPGSSQAELRPLTKIMITRLSLMQTILADLAASDFAKASRDAAVLQTTVSKDTAALPTENLKDANTTLDKSIGSFIRALDKRAPLEIVGGYSDIIGNCYGCHSRYRDPKNAVY